MRSGLRRGHYEGAGSASSPVALGAFDLPSTGASMYDVKKGVQSLFGGEDSIKVEVPGDVAAMVDGLRLSTQEALNQGISRLDVEVPPAFKFGVEGKKGRLLDADEEIDDRQEIARSDRELARLFVEMLQPIGQGLCVSFRNRKLAQAAKKTWKLTPGEASVISFPEKSRSAFAAEVGAPMKFKQQLRDLGCQCLIVVAPYLDQLRLVHDIGREVKDQMGIVLVNARIHGIERKTLKMPPKLKAALQETYTPSYHVRFIEGKKNLVLFHMKTQEGLSDDEPGGSEPWIIARQRELIGGNPVTEEVCRTREEPTKEQIAKALGEFDATDRGVGGKILDVLDKENLAN